MVEVTDPTHPLFGRRFPLLRLYHSARDEGFLEVRYRRHLRLRLPLDATDRSSASAAHPRTKLTLEAVQQLIALVKECRDPCPCHPTVSGPDSPKS